MRLAQQAARPLFFGPASQSSWALLQPRGVISVLTVQGCSSDHCRVAVDGLFFLLPVHLCSLVAANKPFARALCLDHSSFDPGSTGCGGGVSAAASSMSVVRSLRGFDPTSRAHLDPSDPQSLQFSPSALYQAKLAASLESLGVSLLLAPQESVSQRIADLCAAHGIVLLPLPTQLLAHAASIAGCSIVVGDVLDALEEHCSRHACVLSVLPFGQTATHCIVQLGREDGGAESGAVVSSVLLCAPTLAQGRAWRDRFWRCVQRLAYAYSGSSLVPAGLVEALCILQLQEQARGGREGGGPPDMSSRFAPLLDKFLATVASNAFGCDGAQTHCQAQTSVKALAARLGQLLPPSQTDAAALASLTVEQKLELWSLAPRLPTTECQGDDHALDVCSVKTDALRAAISAVKTVLLSSIH